MESPMAPAPSELGTLWLVMQSGRVMMTNGPPVVLCFYLPKSRILSVWLKLEQLPLQNEEKKGQQRRVDRSAAAAVD